MIDGNKTKVKIVLLDDKSDPNVAASNIDTLVTKHEAVALIGPVTPAVGNAAALGVFVVNRDDLGGAIGLFLAEYAPTITTLYYYYSLGLAVVATVVVVFVLRTRLGLSLRALRDDEDTAQEPGVSTFRTKLWAWVVSAFLIGLVGGGIGTIVGPIIGSGFTVWLGEALSGYPEIHVAITGLIVIVVIRFASTGIWGHVRLVGRTVGGNTREEQ